MAIDTRQKKRSVMQMGMPTRNGVPISDGTSGFSSAEMQMLLYRYSGIAFAGSVIAAGVVIAGVILRSAIKTYTGMVKAIQTTFSVK